jgi:pimeloyl-ACP methyl ester carboxylesterase
MLQEHLTLKEWLLRQALTVRAVGRLVGWAALSGLVARPMGQRLGDPARLARGLVVILPGIEGEGFLNHNIAYGLNDARVPGAIEVFDWTRGRLFMFHNLINRRRNLEQADLLVRRIRDYRANCPDRPVHLVAHSGGTGIVAMALEHLRENEAIAAAIFLGSALSPTYDLAPALRRTQCGIYNFYSKYDYFYLGAGTRAFGTIDRRRSAAAGKVGFHTPPGQTPADADLYRAKLHQVSWRKEWLHCLHGGGHTGWADRLFTSRQLARIVIEQENR